MVPSERITLSIAETSEQTGLSEQTIRRLIESGDFPAVQMGGRGSRWLVPVDALRRWLDDRSTAA
jgi:excisionase family DNA binding protein